MSGPTFDFLRWERDGAVLTVWLARAPVNAVHVPMYAEIQRLFLSISDLGADIGCVVLAADGPHFCAGNDLEEFASMTPANGSLRMNAVRDAFFAIQDCEVPVVAAIQGVALGTGLAIAASCDMIVAAEDARFGLPEITIGVMGGARHLMRLVPQPLARRMFFTGDPVPAADLLAVGAVESIVTGDELLPAARRLAARIARHSPTAIRVAKRALGQVEDLSVQAGYPLEQSFTVGLSGEPDAKEALAALREKRDPVWRSRAGGPPV
jgi:enoyl-CoA hydratase